MLLVERDAIGGVVAAIRLCAELPTDGHLGREADDAYPDLIVDQRGYGLMDVAGIGGEEGAKDHEYLSGSVTGSVAIKRKGSVNMDILCG
jgi:hypothetical protein